MYNLTSLLERFRKILDKDSVIKESIVNLIKERTRVSLDHHKINLKEGVLEITTSSVGKNEIRLKEEGIKDELKEVHNIIVTRVLYK